MTSPPAVRFQPLTGIYEPSAIGQLADGRFLVVEDEKQHPFSVVSMDASGHARSTALSPGWFEGGEAIWKLDDLEGLAVDRAGRVYVLTSHSRDGDGDEKKSRDKLARFRLEGDQYRRARRGQWTQSGRWPPRTRCWRLLSRFATPRATAD